MKTSYEERLQIPLVNDKNQFNLYTNSGQHVLTNYDRVVVGERGPYIEFEFDNLIEDTYFIPDEEKYRIDNDSCYYVELRTIDDNIKIYWQKRLVIYADYKIGKLYISPWDLFTNDNKSIIDKEGNV